MQPLSESAILRTMAGNSFGTLFRVTSAGESHGPGNTAIVDGCPAGLELDAGDLQPDLDRRRPGQSTLTTQRREADQVQILSGVYQGRTTGTPIALFIPNSDARSGDYEELAQLYRPGHADFGYHARFGHRDPRGGGRSSARETNVRVAAGAIARKLLKRCGVEVLGYVSQVGPIRAPKPDPFALTLEQVEANPVRCPDVGTAQAMAALIEELRRDCDSIGGCADIVARGVPAGWGEPVFDKLKADLAKALLSIPGVVAFELGSGTAAATLRGSEHNDAFHLRGGRIGTLTNRHGGILGGISSGEPLLLRITMKPTASIARQQQTVTQAGEEVSVKVRGRHDPCLLPRVVPIAEAMVLLTLADHHLRSLGARLSDV